MMKDQVSRKKNLKFPKLILMNLQKMKRTFKRKEKRIDQDTELLTLGLFLHLIFFLETCLGLES